MRARAHPSQRAGRLLLLAALLLAVSLAVPVAVSAATVEVQVKDFEFVGPDGPGQPIRVGVGDTVLFTNEGRVCHTVTRGEGQLGACDGSGSLGEADFDFALNPGEQARVTFNTEEVVPFYCRPHVTLGMTGHVVVGGAVFNETPVVQEPPLLDLSQVVVVGLLSVVGLFVGAEVYWSSTRRPAPLGAAGEAAAPAPTEPAHGPPHEPGEVHASLWPLVVALGATVFLAGLLFPELRGLGLLMLLGGVVAWAFDDARDLRAREAAGLIRDEPTSDRYFAVVVLIIAEVMLFGVLFAYYFWASLYERPYPPAYVEPFDMSFVSANTAVLFGSGATAHFALEAMRRGHQRQFRLLLLATVVMGGLFLVGQGLEYASASFSWTTGPYGTAFFALTGTHGAHVAIGIIALATVLYLDMASSVKLRPSAMAAVTLYWHFVDAVWVGLFAIIYLRVV